MKEEKVCSRCLRETDKLYPHEAEREVGIKVKMELCWDCDFEVMNGRGDYFDDASEVCMNRDEDEYLSDPINTPKPEWMKI